MNSIVYNKLRSPVLIVTVIYGALFIVFRDPVPFIITLAAVQLLTVPAAGVMVFLRLISLVKRTGARLYAIIGVFQVFLFVTDGALLIYNDQLMKHILFAFLGINGLLGGLIITDIMKNQT